MNEKLQKFIDEGILFYPSKGHHYQILYSEELFDDGGLDNYQKPKMNKRYWLRDEDFSHADYKEFIEKQKELFLKRIDKWLEYQKNI